jgi:carbamoyl-phosphate synthase small subunit
MRHGNKNNALSRTKSHRDAMLGNMACSLIAHKRISTTLAKARALRRYVEPLLTKSKDDSTHSRRIVFSYLHDKDAVSVLFRDVAPKIAARPGGYTRILKLGNRLGDASEMAMIELVDFNEVYKKQQPGATEATKKTRRGRRAGGKKEAAPKAEATLHPRRLQRKARANDPAINNCEERGARGRLFFFAPGYFWRAQEDTLRTMLISQRPKALLLLADGTLFEGRAIGAPGITTGEICFNTGMTGYQEIFTDPSYKGQIMVMASAHIGNYGVKADEVESGAVQIAGLVVKKHSEVWSRPGGSGSLDDFLKAHGIPGISDVDTRMLVRHIRDKGAQNALISTSEMDVAILTQQLAAAPSMAGLELSSTVSTRTSFTTGDPHAPLRVALVDFGVKTNIERCLTERGCLVRVFPMTATLEDMLQWDPHGFMLSNGPGDPAAMPASVGLVKDIVDSRRPVFGICLGHQLLAESQGIPTEKMHHGHRGINHPIKNLMTGRDEVTSQNHGFVVRRADAEKKKEVEITHVHLNDGSTAGIRLKGRPVFSVQYHPEASPGPHDARYLFDQFVADVKAYVSAQRPQMQNA